MLDPIQASLRIAGSGLQAQSARIKVVSENMANAQSTGNTPGADPYRRKTVSFESEMQRAEGVSLVRIKDTGEDQSDFRMEYNPGHPAADANGYVKVPNVDLLVESADMREANRSYQANLQVIKSARDLFSMTIDLLKGSSG
jgi:flagellar basal-body rod protein FlgC